MKLLIVESPAKAKTINKYLGNDFKVLASFGHIRDLPSKDGSVDPEKDFSFVWEITPSSEKHVKEIVSALKDADELYLATDPDREGEAISWHLIEELKRRKKIGKDLTVHRVTFNEITKSAVLDALKHPRPIDQPLVDAYLARRALDYLVGFSLSPILWRKLPGSRSAGRVQSVALKLISEREDEIKAFVPQEYWTVDALFGTPQNTSFTAKLIQLDGLKLEKFSLPNTEAAHTAVSKIKAASFTIGSVEKKRVKRYASPPFTTSTLQQEAARKLYFSAKKTMTLAQRLYEGSDVKGETVGLITYMRTDGVSLSMEAINGARSQIEKVYGGNYVPEKPNFYKNKTANAQEAHEAIRPTSFSRTPDMMRSFLEADELKLYDLIYKRAMASQMMPAEMDRVTCDAVSADKKITLRATGQTVAFEGFLKVYHEGYDDKKKDEDDSDDEAKLPPLTEGTVLATKEVNPEQHFTEPPPRYSEASLVKRLEELGIGRPSTYATIISVLQDRNYVRLEDRRFIPEERGRIVTLFLDHFFSRYIRYDFTADLEERLDEIAEGKLEYLKVLNAFWGDFHKTVEEAGALKFEDVLSVLNDTIGKDLFKTDSDRICPLCKKGTLSLKLGKFGAFVGCSNYPECKYTRPLDAGEESGDRDFNGIALKKGQYGYYLEKDGKKASLPRFVKPENVTPESAAFYLSLPKILGQTPEGDDITLAIGMFGPYVKAGKKSKSIPARFDLMHLSVADAVDILSTAKEKPAPTIIGKHPSAKKEITYAVGRFGPFVKMGKTMASLPKAMKESGKMPTVEEAAALIDAKSKSPAKAKAKGKKSS